MGLSIGIVGLPNVGKSTLFNALLKKQQALAANYPFATIEPNVGVVLVPDARLDQLAEVVQKTEGGLPPLVAATVTFVDIAGIVKGASEGEGLGNKFLAHIREADAIALVIRAFEDENVVMTGSGNPVDDREVLMTELGLADLQTVSKQLQPKGNITPDQKKRWEAIQKIQMTLNQGKRADETVLDDEERVLVKDLFLMTMKPTIYVVNIDEAELSAMNLIELTGVYAKRLGVMAEQVVVISAQIEADLASLAMSEQQEYLEALGLKESGLERLIKTGYERLGLQSFLTAGIKEVRAWTVKREATALQAAGVIHTDFMKKFIKAEIVPFEDFMQFNGWKGAREAGKARQEGRDYVMRDGDVVEFKIGA